MGVRVGAFTAHPPISTQTLDTRLLCGRSFPCTQGESVSSGSLLRDSQVGHCASRPLGRRSAPQPQKATRQKLQHTQQAQTRRDTPTPTPTSTPYSHSHSHSYSYSYSFSFSTLTFTLSYSLTLSYTLLHSLSLTTPKRNGVTYRRKTDHSWEDTSRRTTHRALAKFIHRAIALMSVMLLLNNTKEPQGLGETARGSRKEGVPQTRTERAVLHGAHRYQTMCVACVAVKTASRCRPSRVSLPKCWRRRGCTGGFLRRCWRCRRGSAEAPTLSMKLATRFLRTMDENGKTVVRVCGSERSVRDVLWFHGVSGRCVSSLAHRLPGGIQGQGRRRRPMQARVSCSGGSDNCLWSARPWWRSVW